jgi:PAS domain S-box-containing protein
MKKKPAHKLKNTKPNQRTKEKLLINGLRYNNLFKTLQEGFALHELVYSESGKAIDYRIIDVNPAFGKIIGVKSSDAVNHLATELYRTNPAPYIDEYSQVVKTGQTKTFETYFPTTDKYFRIVAFSPSAGLFCTLFEDITEKKRLLNSQQDSEAELRALFQAMHDVVIIYDADGHYLKIAPTNPENFTCSPEKMLGKNVYDILPEEKANHILGKIRETLKTGGIVESTYSLMISDKEVWFEAVCSPISEDTVIWVAHDFTKRKFSQEALRESEDKFRALFNNNQTIMLLIDPKTGQILDANPAASAYYGWSVEEITQKHITDINILEKETVNSEMLRAVSGKRHSFEFMHQLASGEIREVEVFSTPIQVQEKTLLYSIGHDITARKQAEEELIQSQEQLRALTAYWQNAIEAERTTIAREMHDDFGQSMTALKMDLAWLAKRLPEIDERADRIKGMNSLIDESIDLMRRIATDLRPNLLDDLGLNAALEWQTHEFSKRTGILVSLSLPPKEHNLDPNVRTNMFRIFQETLTNVNRHSHATHVNVNLKSKGPYLVMSIRDNGSGITENEVNDHHSLGLLGMRERAVMCGGILTISGVPGKGTTITAKIPIALNSHKEGEQ